nr:MAG TPA: hypothetical protein [Caudoviricetes sp.]
MREVAKIMVNDFKIMKLGMDFMGYKVTRREQLSFHHLIISHKDCKTLHIPSEGYVYWNGAMLRQNTSHDYAHLIQKIDPEIFYLITSEMIDENIKGRLDIENLRKIRDLLLYFEREHRDDRGEKGKLLIKREYITERISL